MALSLVVIVGLRRALVLGQGGFPQLFKRGGDGSYESGVLALADECRIVVHDNVGINTAVLHVPLAFDVVEREIQCGDA